MSPVDLVGPATAVLGPVLGSATRQARELRDIDAAVRAAVPLCRRIGFVHLGPGSGAATTAARVATVLAARRAGMVLAADASGRQAGLLAAAGIAAGPPVPAGVRARARTAAQARAGLGRAPGGCYGLDLRSGRPGPVPAGAWSAGVGPVARFFDVVVTDWGRRHPGYDLEPVLTSSHVVCLVVRTEDAGPAAALLAALAARPATPPVVVAVVAVDRGGRPGRVARRLPAPAVPVRHQPPGPRPPRRAYRIDCLRLAAELMRRSAPPEGGSRDR